MRYVLRALPAGGLGLAAAFLVACGGGSGLLSSEQSGTLSSQLDQVAAAVNQGNCNQAGNAVTNFSNSVDSLSAAGVNKALVANLQQGASTLSRLAARDCQSTTATSTTTSSSPTSSSTTTSSTSSSTPTITSSTTTSVPPTTSSATTGSGTGTTPSGGGGVGGGGGGGGSGNGGAGVGPGN